ncbi:hypothetical protein G5I_10324 [Acromyrmex echinatior]|uniref:Uncharacterized protein n=1 Tax=Acromyrmex echinatior TaxID=103372 RepID=F4WWL0_ACREC|nr:hypothetical protein G5I_10324 [Acromyrmex echinatior]
MVVGIASGICPKWATDSEHWSTEMKSRDEFRLKFDSNQLKDALVKKKDSLPMLLVNNSSVAQLRRTFTAKVLVGDRMTNSIKRNVTEMRLPVIALKGGT